MTMASRRFRTPRRRRKKPPSASYILSHPSYSSYLIAGYLLSKAPLASVRKLLLRGEATLTTALLQREGTGFPTSNAERADRQAFVMKVSATLRKLVRLKYFSWEIEGIEHVPRTGPVVFARITPAALALR